MAFLGLAGCDSPSIKYYAVRFNGTDASNHTYAVDLVVGRVTDRTPVGSDADHIQDWNPRVLDVTPITAGRGRRPGWSES